MRGLCPTCENIHPGSAPCPPVKRDWPEDFSGENGKYMNHCIDCGETFIGHKRRQVCKACANHQPAA